MKTTNNPQPTTRLNFGNLLIRRLSSLVLFICLASTLCAQLPNGYFFRPGNNGTNIRLNGNANIIISNVLGEIVFQKEILNSAQIDLGNQIKGVYVLKVIGEHTKFFKLILA